MLNSESTAPSSSAPAAPAAGVVRIMKRFDVGIEDFLGQGTFSVVRKGHDKLTGEVVAVKTFRGSRFRNDPAKKLAAVGQFERQIDVLTQLQGEVLLTRSYVQKQLLQHQQQAGNPQRYDDAAAADEGASRESSPWPDMPVLRRQNSFYHNILDYQEFTQLKLDIDSAFLRLVTFSRDEKQRPGICTTDKLCYAVFELGEMTLQSYLTNMRSSGNELDPLEVKTITQDLVDGLCCLHEKRFVHLDIKPANIMRGKRGDGEGGRWKLIDVDGATVTGTRVGQPIAGGDRKSKSQGQQAQPKTGIAFTPLYMAPELGTQIVESFSGSFVTSRSMDVWATALVIIELFTTQPFFKPFLNECLERDGHIGHFFEWLQTDDAVFDLSDVAAFDENLHDLLLRHMLVIDDSERCSALEAMYHPYLFDRSQTNAESEVPGTVDTGTKTEDEELLTSRSRAPSETGCAGAIPSRTLATIMGQSETGKKPGTKRESRLRKKTLAGDESVCLSSLKGALTGYYALKEAKETLKGAAATPGVVPVAAADPMEVYHESLEGFLTRVGHDAGIDRASRERYMAAVIGDEAMGIKTIQRLAALSTQEWDTLRTGHCVSGFYVYLLQEEISHIRDTLQKLVLHSYEKDSKKPEISHSVRPVLNTAALNVIMRRRLSAGGSRRGSHGGQPVFMGNPGEMTDTIAVVTSSRRQAQRDTSTREANFPAQDLGSEKASGRERPIPQSQSDLVLYPESYDRQGLSIQLPGAISPSGEAKKPVNEPRKVPVGSAALFSRDPYERSTGNSLPFTPAMAMPQVEQSRASKGRRSFNDVVPSSFSGEAQRVPGHVGCRCCIM